MKIAAIAKRRIADSLIVVEKLVTNRVANNIVATMPNARKKIPKKDKIVVLMQ
jgi:hypothetical protein